MGTGRERLKADVADEVGRRGPRWLLGLVDANRKTTKQGGDNISTLCWWHDESDPSCSLHRAGDTGHVAASCKSCGKGADCFGIAMAAWGVDFRTALDELAKAVGIDPAAYKDAPQAGRDAGGGPPDFSVAARGSDAKPAASSAKPAKPVVGPDTPPPAEVERLWRDFPPLDVDAWEYLRDAGLEGAADLCRGVPPGGVQAKNSAGKVIADRETGRPTQFLYGKRIAVPLHNLDGHVVAVQARDLVAGKAHKFSVLGSSKIGVFGPAARVKDTAVEWVIVAEGLRDYLAATQAVGIDNGKAVVLGVAGVENVEHLLALPLSGKRLVIASDADRAGDEFADRVFAALSPKGVRVGRARPIAGCKDLCDMLAAGQDLARFLRSPKAIRRHRPNVISERGSQALDEDDARYFDNWQRGIPFEVEFWDRAFLGLFPSDIVLVGAETGVGKSELLASIAYAIAKAGRRPRLFALEAYRREITDRLKYRELITRAYAKIAAAGVEPYFSDFVNGHPVLHELLAPFKRDVNESLRPLLDNLFLEYRMGAFSIEDFVSIAEDTDLETDVFLLDHVHFVDLPADDTENKGLTRVLQQISDVAQRVRKPIILAAHVRKNQDPRKKRILPTLDDFQGTSNLPKIVTKAMMLARAPKDWVMSAAQQAAAPYLVPTVMEVQKFRQGGERLHATAIVNFNLRTGTYEPGFELGRVVNSEWEQTPLADYPHWARRPLLRPGETPQATGARRP